MDSIEKLNKTIIDCKKCPRLVQYTKDVAKKKTRRFQTEKYWGKPLPGFGDPYARMMILGLAPAAHGGNRTGRMFTGDSSGNWLVDALYRNGFASKPTSTTKDDGLVLTNVYITASLRCAPPQNKPTIKELENCRPYLIRELELLERIRVIVCLGRIAFDSCRKILGFNSKFSHGSTIKVNHYTVIASYHPSKQNTQTGRLVWRDWDKIFKLAKKDL